MPAPFDEFMGSLVPSYTRSKRVTFDGAGGVLQASAPSGWDGGAVAREIGYGLGIEVDFVINTFAGECMLGLTNNPPGLTFNYTETEFAWYFSGTTGRPYDRLGGGLIASAAQTIAAPVALRIHVTASGLVYWMFGNGDDVSVHQSTRSANDVKGVLSACRIVVGFNAASTSKFTPITLKGDDGNVGNGVPRFAEDVMFQQQERSVELMPPNVGGILAPPPAPRPGVGQLWPRR